MSLIAFFKKMDSKSVRKKKIPEIVAISDNLPL